MYLKIESCYGAKIVNGVKLTHQSDKWWVEGKHFSSYHAALKYIGKRYPMESPYDNRKEVVEQEWYSIKDVSEKHDLTTLQRRALRKYYLALCPAKIVADENGSSYHRDGLDEMVARVKYENMYRRPYGMPSCYVTIPEYAKMKGIQPGTVLEYIKRGEIPSCYVYRSEMTLNKIWLDPNLKMIWGK